MLPSSLRAALNGLPRAQRRAWGTIASRPGTGVVLVLAPPRVPVSASASEAVLGGYPAAGGHESPFTAAALGAWSVAAGVATAGMAVAGAGFGPDVLTGFGGGVLAAVAVPVVLRVTRRCRVVPLPYAAAEAACAIEHASAVARARTGYRDYDSDVAACVRLVLWDASGDDLGMAGAGLPLAVLLHAVLDRNRALLGPHASPAWYPAVSEDPARYPPAPERAADEARHLADALREEARLIRNRTGR